MSDAPPATDVKRPSRTKHVAAAVLEASLIVALTFGLIASTAFAGKGGKGNGRGGGGAVVGGGTISAPVLVDTSDTTVNWGDRIRFNVTSSVAEPWVKLYCYQGGTLVAQGSEGYFERSLDDGVFGLYSPMWSSGAADCTAKLTTSSGSVMATTSFYVNP